MSKKIKILLLIIINIVFLIAIFFSWYLFTTRKATLDSKLLENVDTKIVFLDSSGEIYSSEINESEKIVIKDTPIHVKQAFIAVEDKRFYKHNGIDKMGLTRAIFNNIKSLSFKEGGSTISQQLIKNTHLSSEKTLARKAKEFKLVKKLEKKYSKDQILEFYLNKIYFGDGCYGISEASKYYFDKEVKNLTISESAVLSGLIKAPSNYSPYKNIELSLKRRNVVLTLMKEQKFITEDEYFNAINEKINLNTSQKDDLSYNYLAKKEISRIIDKMPYNSNIFYVKTYYDKKLNDIIESQFNNKNDNYDNTIIITNTKGKILAYKSTLGDVERQAGSVLKPLSVYLPAIQSGIYDSCSIIKDERIRINGYSPRNYNDKYYGNISLKQALATSSNVCAVKVLNEVGIQNSINYLQKMNIGITQEDNNLSLALGATRYGIRFSKLIGAYNIFCNNGFYHEPTSISEIYNDNNKIIYKDKNNGNRVFDNDTAEIVREMLKETTRNGTAKGLSNCKFSLYAKTGTVGNKSGNSDAYTISFNKDYVLGIWVGGSLPNSVTGGGLPCSYSRNVWNNIYKDSLAPEPYTIENAKKILLDKDEYLKSNVVIADVLSPKNETIEELFRINKVPAVKSTKYSCPEIETPKQSVNNNGITIQLCLPYYINVRIFRNDGCYKCLIGDTKKLTNKNLFIDKNISSNKIYQYSVVPYFEKNGKTYYGKEIFLNKIKSPIYYIDDNEWIN